RCELLEAVLRHTCSGRAVPAPQLAHDVVEARLGAAPELEVERERDERALRVIADACIRAVRLGLVEHVPRIEARVRERLPEPARGPIDAGQRLAETLQVGIASDQAAAQQEQILVVARDALEHPELPGMVAPVES